MLPAVLDSAEDLDRKRICRIVTRDFPQYFAVVSRVKQDSHLIGPEGGVLSSTVVPQVQAVFPEGALTKRIRVGLQVRRRWAGGGAGASASSQVRLVRPGPRRGDAERGADHHCSRHRLSPRTASWSRRSLAAKRPSAP